MAAFSFCNQHSSRICHLWWDQGNSNHATSYQAVWINLHEWGSFIYKQTLLILHWILTQPSLSSQVFEVIRTYFFCHPSSTCWLNAMVNTLCNWNWSSIISGSMSPPVTLRDMILYPAWFSLRFLGVHELTSYPAQVNTFLFSFLLLLQTETTHFDQRNISVP